MECSNCQNCKRYPDDTVGCKHELWIMERGGVFKYKSLTKFIESGQYSKRCNPRYCDLYEDMGELDEPQTHLKKKTLSRATVKGEAKYTKAYWARIQGLSRNQIWELTGMMPFSFSNVLRNSPELRIQKRGKIPES